MPLKLKTVKKSKVKVVKPVKKRKDVLKKLKQKQKSLKISVDNREIRQIKKAIKKYKLNLLRNRPIEFQLKNLNSKQTLSFYRKKV